MSNVAKKLSSGGVAVILTDTIYGIVAQALSQEAVERVYKIKKRAPEKPFIILVSSTDQLSGFGVNLSSDQKRAIKELWPGPLSIIFKANKDLGYLKRSGETLAFRMPDNQRLVDLINQAGPLIAPSANPEGLESPANIEKAKEYFGDEIDVYEEGGKPNESPSTLIDLSQKKPVVLRGDESILDDII